MWRSGGDINAIFGAIIGEVANLAGRGHLAGPGGWNYPDSLEVGNAKRGRHLTPAQTRAHFSLWSARAFSPTGSGLWLGLWLGVFADLS